MAPTQEQAPASRELKLCAECGGSGVKKCSRCMLVRYWNWNTTDCYICAGRTNSKECQLKHWKSIHKLKCKRRKTSDRVGELISSGTVDSKKSSGCEPKVKFSYDDFLKFYSWKGCDQLPCGLKNSENTCYVNVSLQCLCCTRPLVAYLLENDHRSQCYPKETDWCLLCELQCHIQKALRGTIPFTPRNIISRISKIGGNLRFGKQEDAHEFMRFAIERMQSDCVSGNESDKDVDLISQETTIIDHIFGGRLQSQVQCTVCSTASERYDSMKELIVEIHGNVESLEECLKKFTTEECLDGDNQYRCARCCKLVPAWKRLTVHEAPNILIITLKRFKSGRFGKLNKRVTFPANLDLMPYMTASDGSDQYDLYAVIVHLDVLNDSPSGHYICFIKNCQGGWYKIDDCQVMHVEEEEVHDQGAYMLLYSRTTPRPRPLLVDKEFMENYQQIKEVQPGG